MRTALLLTRRHNEYCGETDFTSSEHAAFTTVTLQKKRIRMLLAEVATREPPRFPTTFTSVRSEHLTGMESFEIGLPGAHIKDDSACATTRQYYAVHFLQACLGQRFDLRHCEQHRYDAFVIFLIIVAPVGRTETDDHRLTSTLCRHSDKSKVDILRENWATGIVRSMSVK